MRRYRKRRLHDVSSNEETVDRVGGLRRHFCREIRPSYSKMEFVRILGMDENRSAWHRLNARGSNINYSANVCNDRSGCREPISQT